MESKLLVVQAGVDERTEYYWLGGPGCRLGLLLSSPVRPGPVPNR